MTRCDDCPHGRYRETEGGRFMEACTKCEPGRFNIDRGSTSKYACEICPTGRFANEPGMTQCKCVTQYNGDFDEHRNNTVIYGDCPPQDYLDYNIRPKIQTIDYSPRTTYP